jgi:anti-sigma B factor antagonist
LHRQVGGSFWLREYAAFFRNTLMHYGRLQDGDQTTLKVEGELDALTAVELRPTLDAVVAGCPRQVTVDLSDLRLIDSSGVGALVSLYKRVRASGGDVRFVGAHDQPLAIFKLLRLDVVFDLDN